MKVVCYGDSNTWGYDPRGYFGGRYADPWPSLLPWNVQNLGENGQEIPRYPVKFPEDTDLLIVMLGTNDLLQRNAVETVARRMETFLTGLKLENDRILMIAPPAMKPGAWVNGPDLIDSSEALAREYQALSRRLGVRFADAGAWNIQLAYDGVHMTQEGHRAFAAAVTEFIKKGVYHVSE